MLTEHRLPAQVLQTQWIAKGESRHHPYLLEQTQIDRRLGSMDSHLHDKTSFKLQLGHILPAGVLLLNREMCRRHLCRESSMLPEALPWDVNLQHHLIREHQPRHHRLQEASLVMALLSQIAYVAAPHPRPQRTRCPHLRYITIIQRAFTQKMK